MNWNSLNIESTGSNTKFNVTEEDIPISNKRFLELLRDSGPFRSFYNDLLSNSGYDAFFWENKPVTRDTLNSAYECNLVKSDFLAGRSPDSQTFSQYFKENEPVVVFPNLGKDARLIVPCPEKDLSVYTHIGNFVKDAGKTQIHEFWKQVGKQTLSLTGQKKKWLSTSGLGVFWLHARIDSFPKYYQTEEYK